jgi:hypothetical protein
VHADARHRRLPQPDALRRLLAPAALIAGAIAVLAYPAHGRADCGGPESATAAHRVSGQLPPLVVGDSTMLLSVPGLAAEGYDVNAQGCRQFFQAVDLMSQLMAAHQLPRLVVLALGANGAISGSSITAALKLLGPEGLLVLVTPKNVAANVTLDYTAEREDPRHVLVLDWARESAGQTSWFQPDGLHLTMAGVAAFNQFLARALPYAYVIPGC